MDLDEIPTLETERLRLRPLAPSDFDDYAELTADPEVARYLLRSTFSREQAWRVLTFLMGHWRMRGYGMWAVESKATAGFLGMLGFSNPAGWPGFELAWTLARRFWGNGYATEGAWAALAYAFTALDKDRVISLIHPDNQASIRVAERLGERLAGRIDLLGEERLVYAVDREGGCRPGPSSAHCNPTLNQPRGLSPRPSQAPSSTSRLTSSRP
jgi:RimJ/RimL family protein N-acetyltransferase